MIQGICALLLLLVLTGQAPAQTSTTPHARSKLKIGYVKDFGGGCGCSLSLNDADRRKGLVIYEGDLCERRPCIDMKEPGYAKINLDGKDLELRLGDSSDKKNASKVGARSWAI